MSFQVISGSVSCSVFGLLKGYEIRISPCHSLVYKHVLLLIHTYSVIAHGIFHSAVLCPPQIPGCSVVCTLVQPGSGASSEQRAAWSRPDTRYTV